MKAFKLKDYRATFHVYGLGKRDVERVTLAIGEHKEFTHFEYHDEGYRVENNRYFLQLIDGRPFVERQIYCKGTDCDGPHEYHSSSLCPVSELRYGPRAYTYNQNGFGDKRKYRSVRVPYWTKAESSVRDYFAEAMNY